MEQIKGLLVERSVDTFQLTSRVVTLDNSLHGIYKAMNVDQIQIPVVGNEWQMIVDEEGKINGKWGPTMSAEPFELCGTLWGPVLFLGLTKDGDNKSLSEAAQEKILELCNIDRNTITIRL